MKLKSLIGAMAITSLVASPLALATSANAGQVKIVPVSGGHVSPFPALLLMGGVLSIMIDAAITYNKECRELTIDEALTAFALPGVGAAYNISKSTTNKCGTTRR